MNHGWLLAAALPLLAAVASHLALGCSPVIQHPTPSGLVVHYEANEKRLSAEKAAELDARHAALLECLPPEAFCRTEPPSFAIEGRCDTFPDPFTGQQVRGYTNLNGTRRIVLPGSLGAAAHEMAHYYTCDAGHGKGSWPRECGDEVDKVFRRLYPPPVCEEA